MSPEHSSWRARGINLILLATSGVLALLIAEGALRILTPERPRMFRYDELAIYDLVPGAERRFTHLEGNGGHTVTTRINSAGFRGGELAEAPRRRVVVFGDSFIQAEFSALENTFAGRLEAELGQRCGPVEVVNAGVIGYGPDQVLRKMEEDLPRLDPALVVVAIFADNDLGDLLRNKLFELGPAGELRENPVRISASLARQLGLERDLAVVRLARKSYWRWLDWRRRSTAATTPAADASDDGLGSALIDEWLELARQEYESYVVEGDRVVRRIDYDHYDADVALYPDSASAEYKRRLFEAVWGEIAELLARRDQESLALIIPSPIDLCEDYDFNVDEAKYPLYDRHALVRAAEEAVRAHGLPHLSLWRSFAADDPCQLYFRHGDNHWNDRGQALAAALAAERLAPLWPECRSTG